MKRAAISNLHGLRIGDFRSMSQETASQGIKLNHHYTHRQAIVFKLYQQNIRYYVLTLSFTFHRARLQMRPGVRSNSLRIIPSSDLNDD